MQPDLPPSHLARDPLQRNRVLAHCYWQPIEPPEYGVHLRRGRELIAAVTPWHGRWLSMVNLHASALRIRHAPCASREQGMRWVERWAGAAHEKRSIGGATHPADGAKPVNRHLMESHERDPSSPALDQDNGRCAANRTHPASRQR